ncbi:alpha/beta hydrolase [Pseudonocardia benzenivorans]|uniref:Alpha/beta hydrolase n=1 Tax=Pseudonocardia benzenivorans TaxID=228005 RepID=A0ABW3VEQ6_9PSEU
MTFRWLYPFAAAAILFGLLVALAWPASAAPAAAVARDPACAASLAAANTQGDDLRVLGCDPAGRGLAVVALGDPATARSVAVIVPGSDTDLHSIAKPLSWARALRAAAGPDTAVVVWVGYRTPQGLGLDAASGAPARAAAPALDTFVESVRAAHVAGPPHLTVVAHSYGAVVAALAAPDLDADDLVLLASPGARADDVADLHTRAHVFAARAPADWMRWVPSIEIGDLGHGADPASPSFGATLLPTTGVTAHDRYLAPGSATLDAVAAVASSPDAAVASSPEATVTSSPAAAVAA